MACWVPSQCWWQHFTLLGGKIDSRQNLETSATSRTRIGITALYSACYRFSSGLLLKSRQVFTKANAAPRFRLSPTCSPIRYGPVFPGRCLFIGMVNDKGRYRQHPETAAPKAFQAVSLATEIPSRSFTAS